MLASRIADFVRGSGTESFDALVSEVVALHYEQDSGVRRLAGEAEITPDDFDDWRQFPLVPTLAFKTRKLVLGEPREVFRSSGTTGTAPSVHYHPHPELYRAVIDSTFPPACLGGVVDPAMLSLVPSREDAPDSSLAFMIDHVLATWGGKSSCTVARRGGIDAQRARGFLAARQRDGRPVLVLATAFALVQLLEALERLQLAFRLASGSRVFETGGYKGRSRELSRRELRAALQARLGVAPTAIVREYGMTELTSHFYAGASSRGEELFLPPPWVRVRVLDPLSLEESEPGSTGLLAIFDLANLGSAPHVLTEDLAVAEDGGFRLAGRASGAELRGCSLLSEELAD